MLVCTGCGNTFVNRGPYSTTLFNTLQGKKKHPSVIVYGPQDNMYPLCVYVFEWSRAAVLTTVDLVNLL